MTADAAEKWLEENAIRCERFELRISPHTCRTYQQEWPLRCQGCEVADGQVVEPKPARPGKQMSALAYSEKARKGARRKVAAMAKEKGKLVLTFAGDNKEIMQRFAAISDADGTNVADDVATVIELFMDGKLKQ